MLSYYDEVKDKIINVDATDDESFQSLKSLPERFHRGVKIQYGYKRKSRKQVEYYHSKPFLKIMLYLTGFYFRESCTLDPALDIMMSTKEERYWCPINMFHWAPCPLETLSI